MANLTLAMRNVLILLALLALPIGEAMGMHPDGGEPQSGISAAAVLREGFTVRLKIDLDKVTTNEELYVVSPARLALRLAG